MQADALTHQARNQHKTLHDLPDAVHHGHHKHRVLQTRTRGKLQNAGHTRQQQSDGEANVGNKHGQSGKDPDRDRQVQPEQGQGHGVINGQGAHHHQLPTQILPHHVIGLGKKTVRNGAPAWRRQVAHFAQQSIPFHQQIKQDHRHQ